MQNGTAKRHNVQMTKPNRNDCKNGTQTNLLSLNLLRGCSEMIKNGVYQVLNINIPCHKFILLELSKGLEVACSLL